MGRIQRARGLLAVVVMLVVAAAASPVSAQGTAPPSFVVLLTDDQRHDALGFRHRVLTTPAMDRLAAEGVWFESAFAATPVCWSSRATVLTGLHERAHGIGPTTMLPLTMLERSAPRLLREAGYTTGFVGERGFAGKWLPHEPSIRVPLIVRDPRLPAGRRGRTVSELVVNVDLPETLLDMAGVSIPPQMQGASLVPLLEGTATGWRTEVFLEHSWTQPPVYPISQHESLRTEHFKYIHYLEHGREELYDLLTDPDEASDLAQDPAVAEVLSALRERTLELGDLYSGLLFADGFESGALTAWSTPGG